MKARMLFGRALLWLPVFASSPLLAVSGVTRWENTFHQSPSPEGSQSVMAARELADGTTLTVVKDGFEMTALRYDHAGVLQTSAAFYPVYSIETAVIDPFGGVFVATQVSAGNGYPTDLWFMKFDGLTGNALWPAGVTYGSGNHHNDSLSALLVDPDGNLVIAATDELRLSVALLKYDGVTGSLIWGPATTVTDDQGSYMPVALDAIGDIYIAHRTQPGVTPTFHLARRSGATGAIVWQVDEAGHQPQIVSISIDGSGNLVAVGSASAPGGSIEIDKYSGGSGQRIWGPATYASGDATYAIAAAIGPDGSAFIYGVVGNGNQISDFVLKFRGADGALDWGPVPLGLPPGQGFAEGSLAVTGNGDVVLSTVISTGQSTQDQRIWRFGGADGSTVWGPEVITNGPFGALFVASNGRVFVAATVYDGTTSSAELMELDGVTGVPSWGPKTSASIAAGFALLCDLTTSPDGNVVVTGEVDGAGSIGTWATIKYDRATGSVLWGPQYFSSNLYPLALTPWQVLTDASGDVFVTGVTVDGMTVVKYAGSTGAQLWSASASPSTNVTAFALDPSGNPIVTGYHGDESGNYDAVTVKFSGATGATIWGPVIYDSGSVDFPDRVAADPSGNVIVVGHSAPDAFLLKYAAADGSLLWGPVVPAGYPSWLAVDAAGDIFEESSGGITTTKFSGATGATLWGPLTVGDPGGGYGAALALDGAGGVLVAGSLYAPATGFDYAVIKYRASDGAVLWGPVTYDGGGGADYPYGIVMDGSGNAVVTGTSDAGSGEYRTATLSYDGATGTLRWGPVGQNIAREYVSGLAASGSTIFVGATRGDVGYLVTALDEVLGIETAFSTLPAASCGHAVDLPLGALNGTPPYTWSVTSGALPPGVGLGSDGHVAGVPTQEGAYGFRARVQDSAAGSASRDFTLVVGPGSDLVPIAVAEDPVSCLLTLSVAGSYAGYAWQPGGQTTPTIQVNPAEPTPYGVVLDDGSTCNLRGAVTIAPLDPECLAPLVDGISPTSGRLTGMPFLVSGDRFQPDSVVSIGGLRATGLVFESAMGIEGVTPALAPGSVNNVLVVDADGRYGMVLRRFAADFLDVDPGNPFYSDIMKIDLAGITAGCGGGNYCPNGSVSRAQMAVFLLKAEHGFFHVPPPCTGVFADVACPGGFAVDWIEQLAAEGITGGCGGGNYCPDAVVTRAQMSAFLLKAEHGSTYVPPPCTGIFADVPCGAPFADWIEELFHEQITNGCGGNDYCPANPNTRAQMAVFLRKTFGLQ